MTIESIRRRTMSAVAAAVLAAGFCGVLAAPAAGAPGVGASGEGSPNGGASGENARQGAASGNEVLTEAVQLSWDGSSFASSTLENFFGAPVSVPGDSATRTLLVRNDGPADATLRATIVNVNLLDPGAADVHHHPGHQAPDDSGLYVGAGPQGNFYDDLHLSWDGGGASFTDLDANGQTRIAEVPLAQGEQVPITLTYDFPLEATSGNQANVAPRLASFQVLLELGGDLPTPPPTAPPVEETEHEAPVPPSGEDPGDPVGEDPGDPAGEAPGDPVGEAPGDPVGAAAPGTRADLPYTGADLLWPALGAGLLLGLGALVLGAVRRRASFRGHR